MKTFIQYSFGRHSDSLADGQKPRTWWAPVIVLGRLALLVAALLAALQDGAIAWIGLAAATLLLASVLLTIARVALHDMANPRWAPTSIRRFLLLIFANLLEVTIALATLYACVESVSLGSGFDKPIESPGDALMTAASPFGTAGSTALTGVAQASAFAGSMLLLFTTVIIIAAAVNGAYAKRKDAK